MTTGYSGKHATYQPTRPQGTSLHEGSEFTKLIEANAEIARLRSALRPFAEAWKTVTSNEAVVRTCSLAQLSSLCDCELSGADFQGAARAIFNQ